MKTRNVVSVLRCRRPACMVSLQDVNTQKLTEARKPSNRVSGVVGFPSPHTPVPMSSRFSRSVGFCLAANRSPLKVAMRDRIRTVVMKGVAILRRDSGSTFAEVCEVSPPKALSLSKIRRLSMRALATRDKQDLYFICSRHCRGTHNAWG